MSSIVRCWASIKVRYWESLYLDHSTHTVLALIYLGSCFLHIVNGAFQRGAEQPDLSLSVAQLIL